MVFFNKKNQHHEATSTSSVENNHRGGDLLPGDGQEFFPSDYHSSQVPLLGQRWVFDHFFRREG